MGIIETSASSYYASGGPHGNYRFVSMSEVVDSFMATYVGKGKICESVLSQDVTFHALRGMQELSYDTLRSVKDWEISVPSNLLLVMPSDYVNYVKLSWSDVAGVEHIIYPTSKTSNPKSIQQYDANDYANGNTEGDYKFDTRDLDGDGLTDELLLRNESSVTQSTILDSDTSAVLAAANSSIVPGMVVSGTGITAGTTVIAIDGTAVTLSAAATVNATNDLTYTLTTPTSNTWENYSSHVADDLENDYDDDYYWKLKGERYGIDPQHAQVNGSFFIDEDAGKFHFSSNMSGKTVILRYISDGIVTNKTSDTIDMVNTLVPKLAEEAIYKHILYGVLSARKDTPPYLLAQVKKERFAETRKAKIRLSNIKLEELTQVLRGKSKWIKH